ncbi:MAG: exonuclease domain-containing protein [Candidatus Omnitrophica bacterium]|nr:exonuclease domain-containing protein [Candidatus Omnitrophota bacterium]
MDKKLDEIEFTIFDTETTGLDAASGDRIVEIAAVRFKDGQRLDTFQALVNPDRPICEAAFQVNKITPEMLIDAPRIKEVLPGFLKFIQGSCLCSYNAGFDLEFLNNELKLSSMPELEGIVVVDVLKMSRRLLPGLERYALCFVAESLGITTKQIHRAFSDVELTLGVFNKLNEMLYEKGIKDFKNFSNLFSINAHLLESMNSKKISEIQEAIDLNVRLHIRYISSSGEISERDVIPKEIKQEYGRSYLLARCCQKNKERIFRIDGILHLEIV